MAEIRSVREVVGFYIGGGWGSETPLEGSQQVAIIRGADFPQIATGDARSLPVRWEETGKVARRTLREGDIVLEISGGTKDRPTGRTVFVSDRILRQHSIETIPASFCRLLRPDSSRTVPRYLYYWLQDMYADGRTWAYQVQSTGLANFNVEWFLDRELVRLPPLEEQHRIAEVLGALDDLIDTNERLADVMWEMSRAAFSRCQREGGERVPLGAVLDLKYGKALPATIRRPGPALVVSSAGVTGTHDTALLEGPGVVVGRKGSVGSVTWVGSEYFPIDTAFYVSTKTVPLAWAYFMLASLPLSAMNTDSAVPGLNRANALAVEVVRPDDPALLAFEEQAAVLMGGADSLRKEASRLRRTRDELLPLLMSGKVRVRSEGFAP